MFDFRKLRSISVTSISLSAFFVAYGGVAAAEDYAHGDGSFVDNPLLLMGAQPAYASNENLAPHAKGMSAPTLLPPTVTAAPVDIDWSLALRGSHVFGSEEPTSEISFVPQVSLIYRDVRWETELTATANGSVSDQQLTRIDDLSVNLDTAYQVDRLSSVGMSLSTSLAQERINAPGVADTVVQTPVIFDAEAQVTAGRIFGPIELTGTANILRHAEGATVITGNILEHNSDRSLTQFGGSLRAGLAATPIVSPFVEVAAERNIYDAPVRTTVNYLNNSNLEVLAGVAGSWQHGLNIEVSGGYAWTDFDSASFASLQSFTYGADLEFAPEEGLQFALGLDATHNPGNSEQAANVEHEASLSASYQVTPTLNLRTGLEGSWNMPFSSDPGEVAYEFGVGADYQLNKQTSLALDYVYAASENFSDPVEMSHTVSLGVVLSALE